MYCRSKYNLRGQFSSCDKANSQNVSVFTTSAPPILFTNPAPSSTAQSSLNLVNRRFLVKIYSYGNFWRREDKDWCSAVQKMWNASRFCVSSLRRGHANLLCIVPILVYVLPKQVQQFEEIWVLWWSQFWNQHGHVMIPWYHHLMSWNHDTNISWLFHLDTTINPTLNFGLCLICLAEWKSHLPRICIPLRNTF